MKMLIVDDNAEDRQLLKLNIIHHGSEAIEAKDGREGLELAGRHIPDLIISDGLMPRMDGFQLLRAIKTDPKLESIPFLFYSASYAGEHEERLALSLGAEAFVVKPMDPSDLWGKICAIMDMRNKPDDAQKRKEFEANRERSLEDYTKIVAMKLEEKVAELESALDRQKASEKALRESEERFRAISDYTYDWEYWIGTDGKLLWVNPAVERLTGYTPDECAAMPDYPLPLICDQDRAAISGRFEEAKSGSSGNDVAFRVQKKDGSVIWAAASWQSILDGQDRNSGYRVSVRDITERMLSEKKLAQSLAEKDMLLKELKHRTKNNLSIVSSLLRLNIRDMSDERACRILREAIDRVETISSIYEQLNLSDSIDTIALRAYVTNLVTSLRDSFSSENSSIGIKAFVEDMDIKLRFAVPVGLILNELITNAYKYAFQSQRAGEIRVDISRMGGMVTIQVSDDGRGMPDGFDMEKSESLGLKIVSMFVQQLDGDFRFQAGKGTVAVITFPD